MIVPEGMPTENKLSCLDIYSTPEANVSCCAERPVSVDLVNALAAFAAGVRHRFSERSRPSDSLGSATGRQYECPVEFRLSITAMTVLTGVASIAFFSA